MFEEQQGMKAVQLGVLNNGEKKISLFQREPCKNERFWLSFCMKWDASDERKAKK